VKNEQFHIVLVEPEIPNNTGNIGRTCVATNSKLHLVGKLGFEISDKYLKRAGLDYWKHVQLKHHPTWDEWQSEVPDSRRVFYFSTKGTRSYFDEKFQPGDWFVFGKETKGLDEKVLRENDARVLTIPQFGPVRSLNVANAVAIVLYEAIRQVSPRQGKI
jgi:tRNA (cytidine/uridine-2'-O-)-methyltransferase